MLNLMVSEQSQCGSIELICGAMFSGKTSHLMNKVKRHQLQKHKVLVVNYINDNRYSTEDVISSHDQILIKAKKVGMLSEILSIYNDYDVIAIDEGQFFKDIVEVSNEIADNGKTVIIAALDADYRREPFGNIQQLIPIAEVVQKLRSVCVQCRQDASFTKRTTKDTQIELIGSHDIYEPVCRGCYFNQQTSNDNQQQVQQNINKEKSQIIINDQTRQQQQTINYLIEDGVSF